MQVRTNEWDLDRDCDLLRSYITEQMASVLEPGTWRLIETIQVSWRFRLCRLPRSAHYALTCLSCPLGDGSSPAVRHCSGVALT